MHAQPLAARAEQLRKAWAGGNPVPGLAGRDLGLLCDDPAQATALSIHGAAVELGGRVSLVRPGFDGADPDTIAGTGRVLGRLYDGLVCIGMAPELVQAIRQSGGIPVLDGTLAAGAVDVEAAGRPHAGDAGDELRFLWQAALIGGLT